MFPFPLQSCIELTEFIRRSEPDLIANHICKSDTWILEAIWSWPAAFKTFASNFKRFIVVIWSMSIPAPIPIIFACINDLFKMGASHTFTRIPVVSMKTTSSGTYWAVTEAFIRIWRSQRIDKVASSIFPKRKWLNSVVIDVPRPCCSN